MARKRRHHDRDTIAHVTSRGNNRCNIVVNDADRHRFVNLLASTVRKHRWRLHAWVLMSNHYHLLLETPEDNLSHGMKDLNGDFAIYFNRRHGRIGHLFGGRFKSVPILQQAHLLMAIRYIVLNPVRARLVSRAADWLWSSYRATAGLSPLPEWLETRWTMNQMNTDQVDEAHRRFRRFVDNPASLDACWEAIAGETRIPQRDSRPNGLPSEQFQAEEVIDLVLREFDETRPAILHKNYRPGRKVAAQLLRSEARLTTTEIGAFLQCSRRAVANLIAAASSLERLDPEHARRITKLRLELRSGDR